MTTESARFLRAKDIHRPAGILPISRSLFYLLISKGDFPKGRRIAPNVVLWAQEDVIAWVLERGDQFAGVARAVVLDLSTRQQMGTATNKSLAKQRWIKLADEFGRSGMSIKDFAEQRCETGERPFTYLTRGRTTRSYPFETIVRELSKILRERQKERT